MRELCIALERIAECLERIEKALPGCNQEALSKAVEGEVNKIFTSLASSVHTHELYK